MIKIVSKKELKEKLERIRNSGKQSDNVFLMFENESYLKEASLSTIERHTHSGFFVVSAFRNSNKRKVNVRLHKELSKDIKELGLGFISLIGGYVENKGTPEEVEVTELSSLVPYRNINKELTYNDFLDIAIALRDKYNQDGVLFCDDKGIVKEYNKNGEVISYGKFRVNDMVVYFSKIRGRKFEYFNESVYKISGYRYPATTLDRRYLTENQGAIIPITHKEFIKIRDREAR